MAKGFYRQIVEALLEHDCYFRRQAKGDHELWYSPTNGKSFIVDRSCQSRHMANEIMKQAGIDYKF